MNYRDTQQLECVLEQLNDESSEELKEIGKLEAEELRILNRLQVLYREIKNSTPENGHYNLSDLRRLAKERRQLGEDWTMPDHLSACPSCLEAFQIILEGLPHVDTQMFHVVVDDNYITELKTGPVVKSQLSPKIKISLVLAAVVAGIAIAISLFLLSSPAPIKLTVNKGLLETSTGRQVFAATNVTGNTILKARQQTSLVVGAGTHLIVSKNSVFSLSEDQNELRINLKTGNISLRQTAKSASLFIITPLADLKAIGEVTLLITSRKVISVLIPDENMQEDSSDNEAIESLLITLQQGCAQLQQNNKVISLTAGNKADVQKSSIKVIENK